MGMAEQFVYWKSVFLAVFEEKMPGFYQANFIIIKTFKDIINIFLEQSYSSMN